MLQDRANDLGDHKFFIGWDNSNRDAALVGGNDVGGTRVLGASSFRSRKSSPSQMAEQALRGRVRRCRRRRRGCRGRRELMPGRQRCFLAW